MSPGGTVAVAPLAKNVVVYRNGDPFFLGRKFVVSPRRFLTFEAFLNEVTGSIQAPVAVRSIYTPRQGHRITDLGELQNGGQYVAAGFERFKKLNYLTPGMKERSKHLPAKGVQNYPDLPQKVATSQRKRQGAWPCVIHVFRNGDLLSPPFRLILTKNTRQEWDAILTLLSERANLRTGPVKKLCKLNGDLVARGEELVNGDYYVAVGVEKYKDLPYFELLVPLKMSYFWKLPAHRRRILNQELSELYLTSQEGSSDSALLEPAEPGFQVKLRRVQSTGVVPAGSGPNPSGSAHHSLAKKHPHREKVASIFHARPAQARHDDQNLLSSSDQEDESVYKKKGARQEVADAQEIGEDEETQVEFPIDQKAAETVQEEVMPKVTGARRTSHSFLNC